MVADAGQGLEDFCHAASGQSKGQEGQLGIGTHTAATRQQRNKHKLVLSFNFFSSQMLFCGSISKCQMHFLKIIIIIFYQFKMFPHIFIQYSYACMYIESNVGGCDSSSCQYRLMKHLLLPQTAEAR